MERRHKAITAERLDLTDKKQVLLDIEDDYQFNDPELIDILKLALTDFL